MLFGVGGLGFGGLWGLRTQEHTIRAFRKSVIGPPPPGVPVIRFPPPFVHILPFPSKEMGADQTNHLSEASRLKMRFWRARSMVRYVFSPKIV